MTVIMKCDNLGDFQEVLKLVTLVGYADGKLGVKPHTFATLRQYILGKHDIRIQYRGGHERAILAAYKTAYWMVQFDTKRGE